MWISTRRFCSRPSSVSLSPTGRSTPTPTAVSRVAAMPRDTSAATTASARCCERRWLAAASPAESVWPSMRTTRYCGLRSRMVAIAARMFSERRPRIRARALANWICWSKTMFPPSARMSASPSGQPSSSFTPLSVSGSAGQRSCSSTIPSPSPSSSGQPSSSAIPLKVSAWSGHSSASSGIPSPS